MLTANSPSVNDSASLQRSLQVQSTKVTTCQQDFMDKTYSWSPISIHSQPGRRLERGDLPWRRRRDPDHRLPCCRRRRRARPRQEQGGKCSWIEMFMLLIFSGYHNRVGNVPGLKC